MSEKQILVVDDDPAACRSVSDALQRLGHETTVLNNSSLALPMLLLRQVEERPFDVLLLNIGMPDGGAIVEKIAASAIFGPVKIVALINGDGDFTANSLPGVHSRLFKPVDESRLKAALNGGLPPTD